MMHAQKKETVFMKGRDLLSLQLDPSDWKDACFAKSPGLYMRVVFSASKLACQNNQHENATGHDHTEFGLINYRRRLIYFNAWFGRNNDSQIVQNYIPHNRVENPKWNKVEIEKISYLSSFLLFFSNFFAAFTNKKTPAN